jgi:ATP-dependent Clp protease ATP-binding subunit ClpB
MNVNRLTEKARDAVFEAQQLAESNQHSQVEPEHLLVTLAEQDGGVVPEVVRRRWCGGWAWNHARSHVRHGSR